ATSSYLSPPTYFSGGGGLVSSAADYLRFAQMFINGGELDSERLLSPRTVAYMSRNHLPGGKDLPALTTGSFSEVPFEGVGFGLGVAVRDNSVSSGVLSSKGELSWGGLASTHFWIDPREDLISIFLTQLIPSSSYNIRNELRTLVYGALID
ncbi:MAG: serine hydrolase domain-containing protein, partial [Pseudomonadales bacterium]